MQNLKFYRNIPLTFSRIKLHAPTKVILEVYKSHHLKRLILVFGIAEWYTLYKTQFSEVKL